MRESGAGKKNIDWLNCKWVSSEYQERHEVPEALYFHRLYKSTNM